MRKIIGVILSIVLTINVAHAQIARPGAEGIGDPYFPTLGNGGYDAQHYTLDLSVDMENNILSGTVTMQAQATQDLASFNLDFAGFTISDVTVNDAPARDYERDGGELTIVPASPIASGSSFTSAVTYSGVPGEGVDIQGDIFSRGWTNYGDGVFVAAEPTGASLWYPVNDHPLDKATYSFRITVPRPFVVAANGIQQDKIDNGAAITYVWEASQPIASYLVAVNIGNFAVQSEQTPSGVLIRNYFPADIAQQAAQTFSQTDEMIEYFSTLFGPFPFDVYGVAVADTNLPFALEIQTLTLFGRETIDPDSWRSVGGPQGVIAHELAHQWFGDSVSLERWQDIWLNEGFATYATLLWTEHTSGRAALNNVVRGIYDYVSSQQNAPLAEITPPGSPPADNLFNDGVYERGALTLHALRLRVGDEAFFTILRTYAERFRYGNASTDDFIAVAEEISGKELGDFFDSWLYDEQMPAIPEMGLGQQPL